MTAAERESCCSPVRHDLNTNLWTVYMISNETKISFLLLFKTQSGSNRNVFIFTLMAWSQCRQVGYSSGQQWIDCSNVYHMRWLKQEIKLHSWEIQVLKNSLFLVPTCPPVIYSQEVWRHSWDKIFFFWYTNSINNKNNVSAASASNSSQLKCLGFVHFLWLLSCDWKHKQFNWSTLMALSGFTGSSVNSTKSSRKRACCLFLFGLPLLDTYSCNTLKF